MITKASKIIRQLAGKNSVIFNDKLVDGTRSYKVWGWSMQDYEHAGEILKKEGYTATVVIHKGFSQRGLLHYVQPRLHVI